MLRAVALPVLIAALALPAAAAPVAPRELSALRRVMEDSAAAWSRGDLDGFMASYERSPDTAMVTSTGVVRGWRTLRDRYQRNYGGKQGLGRLSFDGLETTALGPDFAILYGRFHLMRPGAAKEETGVFDLIMHRTDQGWRILSDHTS